MSLTGKMILVRGEFYRDGTKIPLEFGNQEQIDLLAKVEAMKDGILRIFGFSCVCGETIEDKPKECPKCGLEFKYYRFDGDIPCVKLRTSYV